MTGRVVLRHDGHDYDPFNPLDSWDENFAEGGWSEQEAEQMRQFVVEGTFLMPDGSVMPEGNARRLRHRILGTYNRPPRGAHVPAVRWLIPGLWPHGHIPFLAGNPKAGKTQLMIELTAALLIPGRRFLGTFEPAELTDEERQQVVWILNAETPADAFNEALEATGLSIDDERLHVEHLELEGGASVFDLTDRTNYERWDVHLMDCISCQGLDFEPPMAVLVDGVTAIVGNDVSRYGFWYNDFRTLMRSLDVSNALVSGHATQAGGHLMGGVEAQAQADGLWSYSSASADDPMSPRYFSVRPRLGGAAVPRTRVTLEDGRLVAKRITPTEAKAEGAGSATAARDGDRASTDARQFVLDKLASAGVEGLRTLEITDRGALGQDRRKALHELQVGGAIRSRPEGRGSRWWASTLAPDADDTLEIDLTTSGADS